MVIWIHATSSSLKHMLIIKGEDLPTQRLIQSTLLLLEQVEQLLDGISPRTVLWQEHEVHAQALSNPPHLLLLMDACIVCNNQDLPAGGDGI